MACLIPIVREIGTIEPRFKPPYFNNCETALSSLDRRHKAGGDPSCLVRSRACGDLRGYCQHRLCGDLPSLRQRGRPGDPEILPLPAFQGAARGRADPVGAPRRGDAQYLPLRRGGDALSRSDCRDPERLCERCAAGSLTVIASVSEAIQVVPLLRCWIAASALPPRNDVKREKQASQNHAPCQVSSDPSL